ncbi:MAG: HAD family phosphatase [Pseudomonadota bacterium]
MQHFKGVIFDMDGCLVDSEPLCLQAIADEMRTLGVRNVTADEIGARFLGVSMATIETYAAERLGHDVPDDFAALIEDKLIRRYRDELVLIEGVDPLLRQLTLTGHVLGLATGASVRRMRSTLEISDLADHFGARAVSAEHVKAGKPEPDVFLEAARRMGLDPSVCLVVEDSPHGILAATRAGMSSVGFVGGSHLKGREKEHAKTLVQAGAAQVFDDLNELSGFVLPTSGVR